MEQASQVLSRIMPTRPGSRGESCATRPSDAGSTPSTPSSAADDDERRCLDELAECERCEGLEHCAHAVRGWRLEFAPYRYKGRRVIVNGQCRFGRDADKAAETRRRQERLFAASHLPKRFVGKTWADFTATAGTKAALAALRQPGGDRPGVLLWGPCGTGKTMMAAIRAQELMAQGKSVLFAFVPDLLDDIRRSFDGDGGGTRRIMAAATAPDVLVLDDLGAERVNEWTCERLCAIVNRRSDDRAMTIVTSNHGPRALSKLHGDRLVSRLCGLCRVAEVTGGDWRMGDGGQND